MNQFLKYLNLNFLSEILFLLFFEKATIKQFEKHIHVILLKTFIHLVKILLGKTFK